MVSEERLSATGLPEKTLATYRLAGSFDLPIKKRKAIAKKLKVSECTVKRHLSQVRVKVDAPELTPQPTSISDAGRTLEQIDSEKHAEAVSLLSAPVRNVAAVAREVGISKGAATRIAKDLDGELLPLARAIEEVRIEDLVKRFGTLSRDAIDAITPEKLLQATAQQLAVVAGIGVDKWQLLRGQPTQRLELNDRREMNELVEMLWKEAQRRGIEIDITPDGGVSAKKSPFKNAAHTREVRAIESGDPAETLRPA